MWNPVSITVLAGLLVGCGKAPAPPAATAGVADTLAAIVGRFAADQKLPGIAVGVWQAGTVVYRGGLGIRGGGAGDQAVGPETVFHLASVTKPFVATAVMQLVEAGRVSLDSTVRSYLPYFAIKGPGADRITIRQVLTHTAGIGDVTDYAWPRPEYDDGALERYIRGLADSTLVTEPGAKWAYSNIGFEILADLIAKVSNQSFEDYVQQHILTPLGMRKSTLLMTDVDSTRLAFGHRKDSTGASQPVGYYPYNRRHAASSTLHSNVDDMLRWGAANLGRGALGDVRILPASGYDELWKPQYDMLPALAERARQAGAKLPYDSMAVGLSWFLPVRAGRRMVWHSGGDTGFRTDLVLVPAEQIAIVVLTNGDWADPGKLSAALLAALPR